MLVELSVENLAVVEKVRVRFHGGFNVLSGETGSGKSIVVDALSLLFGGRASADMVRSGADRMRVSGIFDLGDPSARLRTFLDDAGVETEDRELILEREIAASNGKSRAYAGGKPVTASFLRDLSHYLGSIHGQHDQQGLSSPDAQRELLDAISPGGSKLLPEVAKLHSAYRAIARELDDLDRNEQEKLRMADLWSFQKKEIEAAELSPGEDTRLEAERKVLRNVTRVEENAQAAYALLYDAPESALTQAKQALKKLEDLARIDESLQAVADTLRPGIFAIDEASQSLADYLGNLEADPARLDNVESRLAAIEKLKRKYGESLDEVLAFLENVSAQLDAVQTAGERRTALQKEKERLAAEYTLAAEALRDKRREGARQLVKKVEAELATLAMQRTRFVVRIDPSTEWTSHGMDDIEFLISANVGEDPKPLDKVASGGELSRVSLALKTIAAGARQRNEAARTMVFDEVDAGVSGKAAEAVGRKLRRIAEHDQVLCVTHLPQVASFAESHFSVAKHASRNRTFTTIEELDHDGRTREIGRMLSGERLTDEALRQAEQLIQFANTAAVAGAASGGKS
jgi:DNA repair protein RecN (Recombination protein N)